MRLPWERAKNGLRILQRYVRIDQARGCRYCLRRLSSPADSVWREEVVADGRTWKADIALHHLLDACAFNIPAERAKSNVAVPTRPKDDSYIA